MGCPGGEDDHLARPGGAGRCGRSCRSPCSTLPSTQHPGPVGCDGAESELPARRVRIRACQPWLAALRHNENATRSRQSTGTTRSSSTAPTLLQGRRRAVSAPEAQRPPEPSTLRRRPAGVAADRVSAGRGDGGRSERHTGTRAASTHRHARHDNTRRPLAGTRPGLGAGGSLSRSPSSFDTPLTRRSPQHDPNRRCQRAA